MLNDNNSDAFGKEETMLQAVLALSTKHNWALFPAPFTGEKKSHKTAKHSNGRRWGATRNPNEIRRDFTKWPNANVGAPAGIENGFFVVEADTQEGHGVDGIASVQQLEAEHGPLPETLMAMSPSGSVHRFFKYPNKDGVAIVNSQSVLGPGVDVIGEGGMVLLPPSTRPGKGRYKWLNDLDPAEAPQWLFDLITSKIRKKTSMHSPLPEWMEQYCSAKEPEGLPPGTGRGFSDDSSDYLFDEIAAAVLVIPNNDIDWDDWNDMGMALYAATGGNDEGLAIFHEYSKKSKKYNEDDTNAKWQALHGSPPDEIGIGTIFYLANQADPNWRANYNKEEEEKAEAEFRFEDDASESSGDPAQDKTEESKSESSEDKPEQEQPKKPARVKTSAEFVAALKPPSYLVDEMIQRGYLYSMTAPTGWGKTSVALLIAAHAALGRKLGEIEVEQGKVLVPLRREPR